MRYALLVTALVACMATTPNAAMAFDVQNGGGQAGGSANLAPEASSVPGVSLDQDLRAQLGIADDRATAESKSGLQFGFSGGGAGPKNPTTMGYDESPWVSPRARPGSN